MRCLFFIVLLVDALLLFVVGIVCGSLFVVCIVLCVVSWLRLFVVCC